MAVAVFPGVWCGLDVKEGLRVDYKLSMRPAQLQKQPLTDKS